MMSFSQADYVVKVDERGNYNVHNRYYKNGKEFISPFRNDEMTARYNYKPSSTQYTGSATVNAPVVSARSGAVSNATVKATITQGVNKREVIGEILDKARVSGKSLGKGAATLGRTAVKRHPWGLAFALALEGLAGSKFFWDDEKGDFVREKDNYTYVVFTIKDGSSISDDGEVDETSFKALCENQNGGCEILGYVQTISAAYDKATAYCQSKSFKRGDETINFDRIGWAGHCATSGTVGINHRAVKVYKYVDYVPITPDEFFDESEPDADANPNEWVETSGVKPTDDPSVSVPAGTVAQTNPYTDPQDGKTKQTRWDFEPNGRVRETVIPRPDLVPDSPEAPRLDPPTEEETPPSDNDSEKDKEKDKEQQEQFDLCKEHPEILACQKMGEVENDFFDDIKIPNVVDDTTWEEDRFLPSNGTCPAPKTFHVFDKPVSLSYEPLCRFMGQVRFIILVAFILMSAYLVFGGLRKE